MAYEDRSYSGSAVTTTLTANITNTSTTIPIAASTGWPDGTGGPFHVAIAPANDPEAFSEVIRCSGRTGLTLNVQTTPVSGRGWDGTTAQSHITGAVVAHVATATDLDEANQHIVNTGLDHHPQYLTVVRHDLAARHGISNLPVGGTPSSSVVGDTAAAGTSSLLPRSDHKHAREGFGSPVTAGPVNADGTATSLPRSDHKHAGGIPLIASAANRNTSPIVGEVQIEIDKRRAIMWTGSRWQRGPAWSTSGRTGVYLGRSASYTIPDAGASSYILPWDVNPFDSDNMFPNPDGTTTTTVTVPAVEQGGLYVCFLYIQWNTQITQRSYIEIIHGDTVGFYQARTVTAGEDRGVVTALFELDANHTIQAGLWQNSGSSKSAVGHMYLYRLFA